jgi:hypothetical protein
MPGADALAAESAPACRISGCPVLRTFLAASAATLSPAVSLNIINAGAFSRDSLILYYEYGFALAHDR